MLSFKFICVGKMSDPFYADAANEYLKRLNGYSKSEIVEIAEHRLPANPSDAQILIGLDKEQTSILSTIPNGAFTIALCVEGRSLDSIELSELLFGNTILNTSKYCFIVGGSHGLHENIKHSANMRLSLSKMTFPHSLARVVLLEQLYRCFKIAEGSKYHK